jgi:hypothetical protein
MSRLRVVLFLLVASRQAFAAADHAGRVTVRGLPVPGASVVAVQGDLQRVTVTDLAGAYRLTDLAEGVWTIRVEMSGFATATRDIRIPADEPITVWELRVLSVDEILADRSPAGDARIRQIEGRRGPDGAPPGGAVEARPPDTPMTPDGFRRAQLIPFGAPPETGRDVSSAGPTDTLGLGAVDGLLVDGSVNNSATSPFALPRAFGNSRPGAGSLYTGGLGMLFGTSAWDARPFSFTGSRAEKPTYRDLQLVGTLGGPVRIPRVVKNGPILYVGYQRTSDHQVSTHSALVPTAAQRRGDLSQSVDAAGRPLTVVDPTTGRPFPGNVIPAERISPQAAALLGYYPIPNVAGTGRYNYQAPVVAATEQDAVQTRITQTFDGRNQLFGSLAYLRGSTDAANVFEFVDSTSTAGLDGAMNWWHRLSPGFSVRLRYRYNRQAMRVAPFFAYRTNVSGEAGITGNDQDPANWGPPGLTFAGGIAGLTSAQYARNTQQTHGWSVEGLWGRGRHNLAVGTGVRRQLLDVYGQQDPRGQFAFTGAATGSDLADFLLGIPQTSSIAFGNPDKIFRGSLYDAYVSDDWRIGPTLTVNAGVRWEYEAPLAERLGRLANLDIAPGFVAAAVVSAGDAVGTLTGRRYQRALLEPDRTGIQPRIGLAWRPVAGSSLVVRLAYGVYRNPGVYQTLAQLLAQQPPFSKTFSIENSVDRPLTLATAFDLEPAGLANTIAIDPEFRAGFARNWQVSVQRDLPAWVTMTASYSGSAGSRLMQAFLPNTYPPGATNRCPPCPAGFVYLTSTGRASRHAGQLQLRRRLQSGFTATVQYTLAKATDDVATFNGAVLTGAAIAQDWLDLEAEWGPSAFDQRHLITAQFEYTTGVGVGGGALLGGLRGALVKNWTIAGQLTAGSGLPLTPLYLTSVTGTGFVGTVRGDRAAAEARAAPPGFYVDPAAYTAPQPGHWGTAGRNSLTGPTQFVFNASLGRTFPWGDRLNLDWRIDAINVLNRVTYAGLHTTVGSPQFGLPDRANPMRKLQTSLRLRF